MTIKSSVKALFVIGAGLLCNLGVNAQSSNLHSGSPQRTCGTEHPGEEYEAWLQPLIRQHNEQAANNRTGSVVYTIPVVFHVIHTGTGVGAGYNISDAQIQSQITVLNEDFRKLNADWATVPSVFQGVSADSEIEFCLAQRDPFGLPSTGIERINRTSLNFTAPPYQKTYIDTAIKPRTIWNTNQYLNIWVLPDFSTGASQLLGYATFPPSSGLPGLTGGVGTATTDGVVLWYRCVGRTGNLDPSYNKGRTATHEIGHWLGLRHIWGDATCGNDYCSDTPPQNTANFGNPIFPSLSSCTGNAPNGDMFMNYMDYCNDLSLKMYTANQKTRMQTALQASPMRIAQRNSPACTPPVAGMIESEGPGRLLMYPNPAGDMVRIELPGTSGLGEGVLSVYDVRGALLSRETVLNAQTSITLDLQHFETGYCFVEWRSEKGRFTGSLQVIH
ncbi:MAG: hypothetical protein RLZZ630_2035 [Bacteroidota bacterium]|jgi:hypothetical protein